MMTDCAVVISQIKRQMADQFTLVDQGDHCILLTPFLLPDNTPISFMVQQMSDGTVTITDYGQAADYAFLHGVGQGLLRSRLGTVGRRFGLEMDHGVMSLTVSPDQAATAVSSLINSVQDIGYLSLKQQTRRPKETFKLDVEGYLGTRGRSFKRHQLLPGRTGSREFDYLVAGDHVQLALSLFESGTGKGAETRAKGLAFNFFDIEEEAKQRVKMAVLIDSRNSAPSSDVITILKAYVPNVINWHDRHQIDELLAA